MNQTEDDDQRSLLAMIVDPPNAIAGLCALMAVLHVAVALAPARLARQAWRLFEVSPRPVLRALSEGDVIAPARSFLGYMFFHVNAAHLLINVAGILCFGAIAYRELDARDGERKSDAAVSFIAFFLISGMAAAAFYVLTSPDSYRPMIGASGGAAGIAGAVVLIFARQDWPGLPFSKMANTAIVAAAISAALVALNVVLYFCFDFLLDLLQSKKILLEHLFQWRILLNTWLGAASAWKAHAAGYVFGMLAFPLFERMAGARR